MTASDSSKIYKILSRVQWDRFQLERQFEGAELDLADGFIHFSAANQLAETLAKHFPRRTDLWLIEVQAGQLQNLKWEPSRDGQLFPHLYETLCLEDVSDSWELSVDDSGVHQLPVLS